MIKNWDGNLKDLISFTDGFDRTCSLSNLKDTSVVLVTSALQFHYVVAALRTYKLRLCTVCDFSLANLENEITVVEINMMRSFFVDNPLSLFFQLHNFVN